MARNAFQKEDRITREKERVLKFYGVFNMNFKLLLQALLKYTLGLLLFAILTFLPAGTFLYFNGWLLLGVMFSPILIVGIAMLFKNPELLKKRLNSKEKLKEQSIVVKLSGLMFLLGFVIAGLDFRFNWLPLPNVVPVVACIVFLMSYLLYAEVMRENAYLSRTIEVQENQQVISTGLYGIVRHPMYSTTLLLFLSMPLILGSVYAFIVFLAYPFIIAKRIKSEEVLLSKELEGYKEYTTKVKYRLIPFIW